jgi:hypothetical protein
MTQLPVRHVLSVLALVAVACAPAADAPEPFAVQGQFEDGTNYRAVVPADWNGTLVLDLDFANRLDADPSLVEQWMVANGYAIGGISREPVAYQFRQAVDHLLAVRQMVVDGRGETPMRTITWGNSRGGFVSRLAIEWEPEIFDGALMSSGGGAGEVGTFNSKLDALWTLNVLTGADLDLVGFADRDDALAANAALGALLEQLTAGPEGRARLALAAAFEQFPRWTDGDAPPAADDYEAQLDHIAGGFGFGNPAQVRWGVELVAGGNFSWNHGVDYAALLDDSGMRDLVEALYAMAGLDLGADLAALAAAPRLGVDPRVLATAESLTSYTGMVGGPIMVIDNPADPVDADAFKLAYQRTLEEAGQGDLIRTAWVRAAGHSSHSSLERLTGFVALIERLDTGAWPDTSPAAMTARAEALQGATTIALGAIRFIDHAPPEMLRPWDGSDWGTYQPCAGMDETTLVCP